MSFTWLRPKQLPSPRKSTTHHLSACVLVRKCEANVRGDCLHRPISAGGTDYSAPGPVLPLIPTHWTLSLFLSGTHTHSHTSTLAHILHILCTHALTGSKRARKTGMLQLAFCSVDVVDFPSRSPGFLLMWRVPFLRRAHTRRWGVQSATEPFRSWG